MRNWRRLRTHFRDEGEWGMAPFAAHEFRLVTHFVTLEGAQRELDRHGFDLEAVVPCDDATPLAPGNRPRPCTSTSSPVDGRGPSTGRAPTDRGMIGPWRVTR